MKRSSTSLSVEKLLSRLGVVTFPTGSALDGSRALYPDGVLFGALDPLYTHGLDKLEEYSAALARAVEETTAADKHRPDVDRSDADQSPRQAAS